MKKYNLKSFQESHATIIDAVDKKRRLIVKQLPDQPIGMESIMLQWLGYGEVRSMDIFNAAYNRMQRNRTRTSIVAGGITAVCFESTSHLFAKQVAFSSAHTLTWYVIAQTVNAGTLLGVITCSVALAKRDKSQAIFATQYDKETGAVRQDGKIDKALSRKAKRFLDRYLTDENFASSIPYGESVIMAQPVIDAWNRNLNRIEREEPVFELSGDIKPSVKERFAAIAAAELKNLDSEDCTKWNLSRFNDYCWVLAHNMEYKHPPYIATKGDYWDLTDQYSISYRKIQAKRRMGAAGSAMLSLLTVAGRSKMDHAVSANSSTDFIHKHEAASYAPVVSLALVASWLVSRMVRSAKINRQQRSRDGFIDPNAPFDRQVASQSKAAIDKRFIKLLKDKKLAL